MKKSDMQFILRKCSWTAQRGPVVASEAEVSDQEMGIKEVWRGQFRGACGMGSLLL